MPQGNRSGPKGLGPRTGRGIKRSRPIDQRRGGGFGLGPGGSCVCPNCGEKVAHKLGTPCYERMCSKCGTAMTRE